MKLIKTIDNKQVSQLDVIDDISINLTRIESLNDITYSLLEQIQDVKLVNQLYALNHSINVLIKETNQKIEQNYNRFTRADNKEG